jgi:hypothetical protein
MNKIAISYYIAYCHGPHRNRRPQWSNTDALAYTLILVYICLYWSCISTNKTVVKCRRWLMALPWWPVALRALNGVTPPFLDTCRSVSDNQTFRLKLCIPNLSPCIENLSCTLALYQACITDWKSLKSSSKTNDHEPNTIIGKPACWPHVL